MIRHLSSLFRAAATIAVGLATLAMAGCVDSSESTGSAPYFVVYLANGADSGTVPTDDTDYDSGAQVVVLDNIGNLARDGHSFAGWNTEADGSGTAFDVGASFTIDVDVILYAQWSPVVSSSYTVAYDDNVAGETIAVPSDTGSYAAGDTVSISSTTPARAGYTFDGWNTAADGSGDSYAPGGSLTMGTSNITLYAQWSMIPVYTVVYDDNVADETIAVPSDTGSYAAGDTVSISGSEPVRANYFFAGWNTAADGSGDSYAPGASLTMGASDITLYAQWSAVPVYAVVYDDNVAGETITVPSDGNRYPAGAAVTVSSSAPIRSGYTFVGWATAGGAVTVTAGDSGFTMPSADVTLYAQWTINRYTVSYTVNTTDTVTGTLASDTDYDYSSAVTVAGGTLTRTGYTFVGWNTAADGSGTRYAAGASFTMPAADVVLYAQWTVDSYTVGYDANTTDAVTGLSADANYDYDSTVTVAAGTPTRTGYTFTGWNSAADGSGTRYAAGASFTMPAADVTLYAQWTVDSYTVGYDANTTDAVTGLPADASYDYGSTVTVDGGTPTRTGYTFDGWNTAADGSGTNYDEGGAASFTMPAAGVTLYAQWETNFYTLGYDVNTADTVTGSIPQTINYSYSSTVTVAGGTLTRTGYTFGGWNTAADGSGTRYAAGTSFTIPAADVVLYAQWTVDAYTVRYDANTTDAVTGLSADASYDYGSTVTVDGGTPTRTGYTFVDWNSAADGSGTSYGDDGGGASFTMPAADVTLYAQWETNFYTLGYDVNTADTVTGIPLTINYPYSSTVTVADTPTRTGYTFDGWNTAADGSGTSYAAGASFTIPSADVTLYAQWTIESYTVSYTANTTDAVTGIPSDTDYDYGSTVTVAGVPTRPGYNFEGWNSAADGSGTSYGDGENFTISTADVTLYAQWIIESYTVSYTANTTDTVTGTVASDADYEYGSTVTVDSGTLTRTGYTFGGWNTAADGSGTRYAAGESFAMPAAGVMLYAQWTAKSYTLSYTANTTDAVTGLPADASYDYGSTVTLDGGTPTRAGYTFDGWTIAADGSGAIYTEGESAVFTMPAADVTLYAQWEVNSYVLSYNVNTTDTVSGNPTGGSVEYGGTATVADRTPTRAGYTFDGWNTAADGSGTSYAPGESFTMPTADVTLYAQWAVTRYTLSYVANTTDTVTDMPLDTDYERGSTLTIDGGTPTRAGYTFDGWNSAADGSGTRYAGGASFTMPAADAALYAQWTVNSYTVSYTVNTTDPVTGTVVSNADYEYGSTVTVASGTLTRTGYTFGGWNTAADGSGTSYAAGTGFTMPAVDVTLYAQWSLITYAINYNGNASSDTSIANLPTGSYGYYDTSFTIGSEVPVRDNAKFVEWNTAADGGGTSYAPGSTYTIVNRGDVTLYAQWEAATPLIVLLPHGDIATAGGTQWYYFDVTPKAHTVIWEDLQDQDINNPSNFTGDVTVTAYKGDLVNTYFEGVDSGSSSPWVFTPTTAERVYLKVTGSVTGDYEIGYETRLSVGDIGQAGGIVFYVDEADAYADWDYLEVAPRSTEVNRAWGPQATDITAIVDADSVNFGEGAKNTAAFVGELGADGSVDSSGNPIQYAAQYCNALSVTTAGGVDFSDWFLPSYEELRQVYLNLHLNGLGDFADNKYWSSSEFPGLSRHSSPTLSAWDVDFANGGHSVYWGNDGYARWWSQIVRAVRAF